MNKAIMKATRFAEQVKKVEQGICPLCHKAIVKGSFRDALSEREYTISGLCQSCQDEMFGGEF